MDKNMEYLLTRVLEMNETEMRACLIMLTKGVTLKNAIDATFNWLKRDLASGKFNKPA